MADAITEALNQATITNIDRCIIDPATRTINVPSIYSFLGVTSDENAKRILFQCPKIVDDIDLSTYDLYVNYQNANGDKNAYLITDVTVDGDNILFSWLLSRSVTAYKGTVNYIVCAKTINTSGTDILNEWNTVPAIGTVSEGLEASAEIASANADVIEQLLLSVSSYQEAVTSGLSQINNKVDKISGKGLSTEDYTTAEKTKLAILNIDQTYNATSQNAQSGVAFAEGLKTRVPTGWTKLFDNYTTDTEQDTLIVRDTSQNLSQYTEFIVDIKIPAGGAKGIFKTMIGFANGATTAGIYNNYLLQNLISTYAPNIPNTPIDQTNKDCWLTTHIIMFNGRSIIHQATNTNSSDGYPLCFSANTSTQSYLSLRYAYGFVVKVGGRNFPAGTTFSFYAR